MELDLIEALSLITNCTKNKTLSHVLSNNGLCLRTAVQYVLLFLVLAVGKFLVFFVFFRVTRSASSYELLPWK